MSQVLTDDQRWAMVARCHWWCQFVSRANEELEDSLRDPGSAKSRLTSWDLLYVLALSLTHVRSSLEHLRAGGWPPVLAKAGERFLSDSVDVQRLRDLLEHEDEYVLGHGRHMTKVGPPDVVGRRRDGTMAGIHGRGLNYDPAGKHVVRFLGNDYRLHPALRRLPELTQALDEIVYNGAEYWRS